MPQFSMDTWVEPAYDELWGRLSDPNFRSSKNCRAISSDGAATLGSARRRRCCARLTNGSGGGCAPSPGSSGSVDACDLPSCDAAASAGIWRRKPPAAHTAPGGSQAAPRSPSPCQRPSSVHSASLPSPNHGPHHLLCLSDKSVRASRRPDHRKAASVESILTEGGFGFRIPSFARPRNDDSDRST